MFTPGLSGATAILFAVVGLSIILQAFVRSRIPFDVLEGHNEVAGVMLGIVGGLYSTMLAFMVVAAWDNFEDARDGTVREANAIADLHRLASGLSDPLRSELRADIDVVARLIVSEEWPAMRDGRDSIEVSRRLIRIWTNVTRYQPAGDGERNVHLVVLQRLAVVGEERRQRLAMSVRHLPHTLWIVLLAGAGLTIVLSNFFGLRFRRSAYFFAGSLAALVTLALLTLQALNHPFSGYLYVLPDEFEQVTRLMREQP